MPKRTWGRQQSIHELICLFYFILPASRAHFCYFITSFYSSNPSLESRTREFLEQDSCWNRIDSWKKENNHACLEPPKAGNFLCRECPRHSQHYCCHFSRMGPAILTPSPVFLAFTMVHLSIQKPRTYNESGWGGLQRDFTDTDDPMTLIAWMRPGPSGWESWERKWGRATKRSLWLRKRIKKRQKEEINHMQVATLCFWIFGLCEVQG